MTRKVFIILLITSFIEISGYAQDATMRVSVQVINGSGVETKQPNVISFFKEGKFSIGRLKINGIKEESVLVTSVSKIKLTNKRGDRAKMEIISYREEVTESDPIVHFKGISNSPLIDSTYGGSLKTTIEYL